MKLKWIEITGQHMGYDKDEELVCWVTEERDIGLCTLTIVKSGTRATFGTVEAAKENAEFVT